MAPWGGLSGEGYAMVAPGDPADKDLPMSMDPLHRSSRSRRLAARRLLFAVAAVCVLGLFVALFANKDEAVASFQEMLPASSYSHNRTAEEQLATNARTLAHQRLKDLLGKSDLKKIKDDLVLTNLGDVDLDVYRAKLRKTFDDYFSPLFNTSAVTTGPYYDMWAAIDEQLTPGVVPRWASKDMPRHISSSVRNKKDVPGFFSRWADVNKGWKVDLYDDADMVQYLQNSFAAMGRNTKSKKRASTTSSSHASKTFFEQWTDMPHNILRVDTFRYLKIFLDGGVYSDSDTASVYSIDEWPGMRKPDRRIMDNGDETLQLLENLPRLASAVEGSRAAVKASSASSRLHKLTGDASSPLLPWSSPGLVLGIESDAPSNGKNYKDEQFARPLQMTQFSFLAKPFHPVFLDVLGTIMDVSIKVGAMDKGEKDVNFLYLILDWTGPGIMTDAVFRYLLARYGAEPLQVSGYTKGVRIGDVLVYPEYSFRTGEPDKFQGDFRFIHHGVMHRWMHND